MSSTTFLEDLGDAHADLTSHDTFVKGVPHATFQRLRQEDPIAWIDESDGSGFWAVTRHADIISANKNFKTFTSTQNIRLEEMAPDELEARRTMQEMDPPDHTRLRSIVNPAFSRKTISAYEPQIRELATQTVEKALNKKEFDAVNEIARPIIGRILGRILGAPEEDGDWLTEKGDALIGNTDSDFTTHVVDQVDTEEYRLMPFRSPAAVELFDYAEKQAKLKRNSDSQDVMSMLLRPLKSGEYLTDLEFKNFLTLVVAAGSDTTRYSIAASLHAIANHPSLLEQLQRTEDASWETVTNELIRWASPTMHFRRTATQNIELHGKQIKAGDKVVLWWISGNRDEAVFENPFSIDPTRDPNPHIAFGQWGPHACLGQWLARLEVQSVVRAFVKNVKRVTQSGPHVHLRSNFINGIKYLPITVVRN